MSGNFARGSMRLLIRLSLKPLFAPAVPVRLQRSLLKAAGLVTRVPRDVPYVPQALGGVPGECLRPTHAGSDDAVILYLHGGGYCVGSPASHRPITASLARASGLTVYAPDYRLAPEHPYPAALNDAVSAYRALLDDGHRRIVLAGDSAGGGLALAAAISLRDAGLPAPVALVLFSPWTDLACKGATMQSHARHDPMLSQPTLQRWAAAYTGRVPADHPLCSPLHAELRGLPPTLIQVGSDEVLLDDTLRLEKALLTAKGAVTVQVYPHLWHDFQLQAGVLDEADEAIAKAAAFIAQTLAQPARAAGPRARLA